MHNKRQSVINILFLMIFFLSRTGLGIMAQEETEVLREWRQYNSASKALYNHLAEEAYELLKIRSDRMADIKTPDQFWQQQELIQENLRKVVGPFPEKTHLNARITRTIKKEGYRLEHIVYESRPSFYVSSSLYIPDGVKRKAPTVIYCSGHSPTGYRVPSYQHIILNLVRKGFVVFAFDPIGQGERIQYYNPETGTSLLGGPANEHSYPGVQAFITGNSLANYMIWDGIRAVDYLLSRKEVDPSRIGITGRSGGGTQSSYIPVFDERIKAAAPECFLTNLSRLFESIGPQDAEQNFFHGISHGIDNPDLLLARAPEPIMMITTSRDFFSIQGARETAHEVSEIYRICGKPGNFSRVEDDSTHASTRNNREAMYAFFQKHLDNPGDPTDREVIIPSEEELQVSPTGQVVSSYKGETVFSLNRIETKKLHRELQADRKDNPNRNTIIQAAMEVSGFMKPGEQSEPVFTGGYQKEKHRITKYFVKGEGDYVIPYLVMTPEKPGNKALIYLHPKGKAAALREGTEIEWFINNGITVLVPDMIGVGELGGSHAMDDTIIYGGSHYYINSAWYASIQTGRSIAGIRAGDVLRLTKVLEREYKLNDISCLARGNMGPVLLHAAAFEQSINRIALIEPLSSYRSLAMSRFYQAGYIHNAVGGALQSYDLPDLAASLAPRKLVLMDIKDAMGDGIGPEQMQMDTDVIKKAYQLEDAGNHLMIVPPETDSKRYKIYREWIN